MNEKPSADFECAVDEALLKLIKSGHVEISIDSDGQARYRLTQKGRERADRAAQRVWKRAVRFQR